MSPDIVQALVKSIELKDLSTAAHTWRVVLYARAMAERRGLDRALIERITVGAALHDVGKIDIPDAVLQKPGPLTHDERTVMQSHAALGHERLVRMGEDDPVILGLVRHHHERFDGLGYPDRLAHDTIPLGARFFAVIDSFDAMTSVRPYRTDPGARAVDRAVAELRAGVGSRYAPEAVDVFASLLDSGEIDWILSYFRDYHDIPGFALAPGADHPAAVPVPLAQPASRGAQPPPGSSAGASIAPAGSGSLGAESSVGMSGAGDVADASHSADIRST